MHIDTVRTVPGQSGTSLLEVLVALTLLTIAGTAIEYLVQGTIGQIQMRHRKYLNTMRMYKTPLKTSLIHCIPEATTPIILWNCTISGQQRRKAAYE